MSELEPPTHAPWFIEGPIDARAFEPMLEKVLLPTVRPGDIVVVDNPGSHIDQKFLTLKIHPHGH